MEFQKARKGFTLVELMIVVAIIGILAALAIPAFIRYIQASKAAEAPGIVKIITTGAVSYFLSDQMRTNAQPWHTPPEDGSSVGGGEKVFPSGDHSFSTHGATPILGGKRVADATLLTAHQYQAPAVAILGINPNQETYFSYHYEPSGVGADARLSITACHGFAGDDAACDRTFTGHRYNVNCTFANHTVGCTPGWVLNDFQ